MNSILSLFIVLSALGEKPPGVDERVVFLGDSITHNGGYVAYIDAVIRLTGMEKTFELINMGLSSETASGLSEEDHPFPRPCVLERIDRVLKMMKPDTIVLCYGMNDGIYAPLDDERFKAYRKGINTIIRKADAAEAKVILLTPFPFDAVAAGKKGSLAKKGGEVPLGFKAIYPDYDKVLARYSKWILKQGERVSKVVDIRTPITDYLAEKRKEDPDFVLSGDGVHMNAEGQMLTGRVLLKAWDLPEEVVFPGGYYELVRKKMAAQRDGWLAHVGHKRPMKGTPPTLEEAFATAAELEDKINAKLAASSVPATP
ncbi:MAG: SGNH/GDSL hydrolase family protein [Verrucomicrobiota bacterium]